MKFLSGGHILKLDLLKSRLEPLIIRKGYTPSNSLYDALKFWQVDQNPNKETLTGRHQIHKSISGWTTDNLEGWVVDAPVNIYDVGASVESNRRHSWIYEPFTGSTFLTHKQCSIKLNYNVILNWWGRYWQRWNELTGVISKKSLRWSVGNSVTNFLSRVPATMYFSGGVPLLKIDPTATEDSQIRRYFYALILGRYWLFFDRYWYGTSRCWLMGFIFFCRYWLCLIFHRDKILIFLPLSYRSSKFSCLFL